MSNDNVKDFQNPGDIDGRYKIDVRDDGIYLLVSAPNGNGRPIAVKQILDDFAKRNIDQLDKLLIEQTITEGSNQAVKVAQLTEPNIQITVARDKMEAMLEITADKYARQLTIEEVIDKIKMAGVIFGLDELQIKNAVQRPGSSVVCAKGNSPVEGHKAYIRFLYNEITKGKPTALEGGKVDYKSLNLFTTVLEGAILAEKVPATEGEPGTNVMGQSVMAKPGKDVPLAHGKNVRMEDNKLIAAISGQLRMTEGKISVVPVIDVNGDVDLSTGNIEFIGDVTIRGSVQSGFCVKADGNVEIQGTVSGGTVEGKNIVIRSGIQGMHTGYIKAAEDVTAKFAENAVIYAGRDVIVSDVILHSRINAGRCVVVDGRRGLIAGGQVSAGEEIRVKTAGTLLAPNTVLEVGVNPLLREEYIKLKNSIKKQEHTLDQTLKALGILRSIDSSRLSEGKKAMLLKLTKAQFQLVGQLDNTQKRMAEIERTFELMRQGKVQVSEVVYPGVKIVIGTLVHLVRETTNYATFYAEDGEIKLGSFQ